MRLFGSTYQIFRKDLVSEVRSRYAVNSLLMFVVVIISIIRFSIGNETVSKEVLAGLLWIAIFFSASSGLARVFIKEEEKETSPALKLSAGASEIFLGKLFFNFILTFALNLVIVVLFILITGLDIIDINGFIMILVLGNTGLVAASTIIAAIISKANAKGTLYPVLSFPVLLPLLLSVINGTKLTCTESSFEELMPDIQILISYSVVVITVSILLFRFIWED